MRHQTPTDWIDDYEVRHPGWPRERLCHEGYVLVPCRCSKKICEGWKLVHWTRANYCERIPIPDRPSLADIILERLNSTAAAWGPICTGDNPAIDVNLKVTVDVQGPS